MGAESTSEAGGIEETINKTLTDARSGGHASAVMTAMLIHRYPKESQEMGISTLYESLLLQSLQSNDPELLACLAEELMMGVRLAFDADMALRAASKADAISGFMGAFVMGRMTAETHPDFALRQFKKGCKEGHLASLAWTSNLQANKIPLIGNLLWPFLNLGGFFSALSAVRSKDKRRLWRVFDGMRPDKNFHAIVGGSDRQYPFSAVDQLVPPPESGEKQSAETYE